MSLPVIIRQGVWRLNIKSVLPPLRYGYPLVITGYAGLLMESGDRYILRILGTLGDVGLYSLGYKFSGVLNQSYVLPVQNATDPNAFQLEHDPEQQREFLCSAATLFYAVGILLVLGMSLFSKELIQILTSRSQFWGAWIIVPIITLSYLHGGLGNFFIWGMRMRNQSLGISAIAAVSGVLNIVLNIIFIPFWGILGAAAATLIAILFSNALQLFRSIKAYSLYFDLKRIAGLFLIGASLFGAAMMLAATGRMLLDLSIKLIFFLIYPALLYFLPRLTFSDNAQYQNTCQALCDTKIFTAINRALGRKGV